MNRIRLRIAGKQENGHGGTEVRVDVVCVPLITPDVVGTAAQAIWDNGDDYYCVYGPTALDAIRVAMSAVEDGTVAQHFAAVATHYGVVT